MIDINHTMTSVLTCCSLFLFLIFMYEAKDFIIKSRNYNEFQHPITLEVQYCYSFEYLILMSLTSSELKYFVWMIEADITVL